jgi:hypothetical protein
MRLFPIKKASLFEALALGRNRTSYAGSEEGAAGNTWSFLYLLGHFAGAI